MTQQEAAARYSAWRRNRNALADDRRPCEWNPGEERAAVLGDLYHGLAAVDVVFRGERLRVCRTCQVIFAMPIEEAEDE